MGPPGWAGMFGAVWIYYEKDRREFVKGKTWRDWSFPASDRKIGNSGIILDCRLVRRRVGGAKPGLQSLAGGPTAEGRPVRRAVLISA